MYAELSLAVRNSQPQGNSHGSVAWGLGVAEVVTWEKLLSTAGEHWSPSANWRKGANPPARQSKPTVGLPGAGPFSFGF